MTRGEIIDAEMKADDSWIDLMMTENFDGPEVMCPKAAGFDGKIETQTFRRINRLEGAHRQESAWKIEGGVQ